jgi:mannose-6-phosphate isomerase
LQPWYDFVPSAESEPIGEVWLTGDMCVIETGAGKGKTLAEFTAENSEAMLGQGAASGAMFPLLIKVLFPHEKLSVQVHPDDALARELHNAPVGKTECWYVLEAEPGATIPLGLRAGTTQEQAVTAIREQKIESLLDRVPARAGNMLFVAPGTVHAIDTGVVLLETQQNSDWTYRLYDYGRGRELHLDAGVRAMRVQTEAGIVRPENAGGYLQLLECKFFEVDKVAIAAGESRALPKHAGVQVVFAAVGAGQIEWDDEAISIARGDAVVVPASAGEVRASAAERLELICGNANP